MTAIAEGIHIRGRQLFVREYGRRDVRVYENRGDSLFEPRWTLAGRGVTKRKALDDAGVVRA